GLARKIGLDEGIRRFYRAKRKGILVCLDADTTVELNYLKAIEDLFEEQPACPAASIRYAHPLGGLSQDHRLAIVQYELHLRIFLGLKRWTGYPYAFESIGSAMAVRSLDYCKQGGMNTRKAGEDFYYINKFTPLGGFGEINNTCVYPSGRISDRVPFGTGRAMQDVLATGEEWKTYPPSAFALLRGLFAMSRGEMKNWQSSLADTPLGNYLIEAKFSEGLSELILHTASEEAFRKRFFRWFDPFRIMKYLHFVLEAGADKIGVVEAGNFLLKEKGLPPEEDLEKMLAVFRSSAFFNAVPDGSPTVQ
ncbi:MAG: glycosyltransferase family 2 protein, partial [Saprospiraceae bacterium]|nr:glycosyltransferase family 2 protein [Saprospiraceae bacterium]